MFFERPVESHVQVPHEEIEVTASVWLNRIRSRINFLEKFSCHLETCFSFKCATCQMTVYEAVFHLLEFELNHGAAFPPIAELVNC